MYLLAYKTNLGWPLTEQYKVSMKKSVGPASTIDE